MTIPAKSFDSPVSSMLEDRLDRWRIAKDVYSVICQIPFDSSCRIGVFGGWGQGKTSLLNFVETLAKDEGFISFWLNPSQSKNSDNLWDLILESFLNALACEQLLIGEVRRARIRRFSQKLMTPIQQVADLSPYSKAAIGSARNAFEVWLKPNGKQVNRLREKLNSKRVMVFVDDLDRADPAIVPNLLLALRDVLDLPGFAFILAFDEDIVAKSLLQVNAGWVDGKAFIDKSLDFTFTLKPASPEQQCQLVTEHIRLICPWMETTVIEQNADLLPETPRKAKSLIRNLLALTGQVKRHSQAEIQWVDLFFGQLIRLESATFLQQFLKEGKNKDLLIYGTSIQMKEPSPNAEMCLKEVVDTNKSLNESQKSTLLKLLTKWNERRGLGGDNLFQYYAGFGTEHRNFTLLELGTVLDDFKVNGEIVALEKALKDHAKKVSSQLQDVSRDFLRLLAERRAADLNSATDSLAEESVAKHLDDADAILNLVKRVLLEMSSRIDLQHQDIFDAIESIVGQAFRWISFDVSPYIRARKQEKQCLLVLAESCLISATDWVGLLQHFSDPHLSFTGTKADIEKRFALNSELRKILDERLADEALRFFGTKGAHQAFYGQGAQR